MGKNLQDITLRSEQMNEMLSKEPSWLLRSGNILVLSVIVLVIFLSWLIKYPDEIQGEVLVSSTQPPIEFSNQSYIQLKSLNVREGQEVQTGSLIAQFDNLAKPEHIAKAEIYLDKLEAYNERFPNKVELPTADLSLGTFQESWTLLSTRISAWNNEHSGNFINERIAYVEREIKYRENLKSIASSQIKLSEKEYELIREDLLSGEKLAEQNAISRQALNQDKRNETQASKSVQSQKEQYVQNLIQLNTLRQSLLTLKFETEQKERQTIADISVNISSLRTSFKAWGQSSVWIAPCAGKIIFNKLLQVNRFYGANQASIVLVPKGSGYTAFATISSTGAGKVRPGQRAFIELSDYPKVEYGLIEGIVTDITQIEKGGKYEVSVRLPRQLTTSYGKIIPAKAQLSGKINIVTDSRRVLERIFKNLTGSSK